jgi:hypothetical protein
VPAKEEDDDEEGDADEDEGGSSAGITDAMPKWDAHSVKLRGKAFSNVWQVAASNLARRMALKGPFGGWELIYNPTEGVSVESSSELWRHHCVDLPSGIETCTVLHLQALRALCEAEAVHPVSSNKKVIISHLKKLDTGRVKPLGIFRNKGVWYYENVEAKNKSDSQFQPSLQATVLSCLLKCAKAVRKSKYSEPAAELFAGLNKQYPEANWVGSQMPVFRVHQVYRGVAESIEHIPDGSNLFSDIRQYLDRYELFVWKMYDFLKADPQFPKGNIDLVHAMHRRYNSALLGKSMKKRLKGTAADIMKSGEFAPTPPSEKRPVPYLHCDSLVAMALLLNVTKDLTMLNLVTTFADSTCQTFQASPKILAEIPSKIQKASHLKDNQAYIEGGFFFPDNPLNHLGITTRCVDGFMALVRTHDNVPAGMDKLVPPADLLEKMQMPGKKMKMRPVKTESQVRATKESGGGGGAPIYAGLDSSYDAHDDIMSEP